MNLDLATTLNVVSTMAIVIALVFTGLQVREANRARRDQTSVTTLKMTFGEEWTRASLLVSKIKANANLQDINEYPPETIGALYDCGARIESLGYMVYRGMVELEAIDDLVGGVILMYWSRARGWIEAERRRTGNPKLMEWCQWLAERIAERHAQGKTIPAYLRNERSAGTPGST